MMIGILAHPIWFVYPIEKTRFCVLYLRKTKGFSMESKSSIFDDVPEQTSDLSPSILDIIKSHATELAEQHKIPYEEAERRARIIVMDLLRKHPTGRQFISSMQAYKPNRHERRKEAALKKKMNS